MTRIQKEDILLVNDSISCRKRYSSSVVHRHLYHNTTAFHKSLLFPLSFHCYTKSHTKILPTLHSMKEIYQFLKKSALAELIICHPFFSLSVPSLQVGFSQHRGLTVGGQTGGHTFQSKKRAGSVWDRVLRARKSQRCCQDSRQLSVVRERPIKLQSFEGDRGDKRGGQHVITNSWRRQWEELVDILAQCHKSTIGRNPS